MPGPAHLLLVLWTAVSTSAAPECASCATLDGFTEALHLQLVPRTSSPQLYLARFEFNVEAELSVAFRAGQFDLFPRPLGKLLNAHRAIAGFEAALTQGRWKDEEWGPAPREFRPPGAVLVAATDNASDPAAANQAWKFLTSALSGALCASFEGMDPDHGSFSWVRPLGVPWAEQGRQLRFSTLPYEPVCTENLTPWLKLLPCGKHRGLAALLSPLAVAESPLVSLSLAVAMRGSGPSAAATLRASLEVVLPKLQGEDGFAPWFGGRAFAACHAADASRVVLRPPGGATAAHAAADFGALRSTPELLAPSGGGAGGRAGGGDAAADGLSVMRDILSQEGKSERTHGRYLLRFTNLGRRRRVRFMDQLPFFLRPLWHTFQASFQGPAGTSDLSGLDAMRKLQLRFVPSSGGHVPTELFLTVDVPAGGTVSVSLDVLKSFIQLREFSYACEKGFDVSSAAWLERDLPEEGDPVAEDASVGDFLASLGPLCASDSDAAQGPGSWRLRFTEGLLVLVPMPDFSMPFNVIALSSTAVTFFFGSIFRLTAAGRVPHWVLKKEEATRRGPLFWIRRLLLVALLGGAYALHTVESAKLEELRGRLPEQAAAPVVDLLQSAKASLDGLLR